MKAIVLLSSFYRYTDEKITHIVSRLSSRCASEAVSGSTKGRSVEETTNLGIVQKFFSGCLKISGGCILGHFFCPKVKTSEIVCKYDALECEESMPPSCKTGLYSQCVRLRGAGSEFTGKSLVTRICIYLFVNQDS